MCECNDCDTKKVLDSLNNSSYIIEKQSLVAIIVFVIVFLFFCITALCSIICVVNYKYGINEATIQLRKDACNQGYGEYILNDEGKAVFHWVKK